MGGCMNKQNRKSRDFALRTHNVWMGIVLKPYNGLRYRIIAIHVQNNNKLDWPVLGLWFGILTTCGMSSNE